MRRSVGVLAVQGDFERHIVALEQAGIPADRIAEVRESADLCSVDRLIIPGGESTTVGLLLKRYGLGEAIREAAQGGLPIWGTCMGMILMAREIRDRPEQYRLGILDVEVERNAFGAQVHSFEQEIAFAGLETPLTAVFIRAPAVSRLGPGVEPLATLDGRIVAVRSGRLLGTSFHPELTDDHRVHQLFLGL